MRGRGKKVAQHGSLAFLYPTPAIPTVSTGTGPESWWIPPDGKNAYVACFATNVINQYTRNVNTGELTPMTPPNIGANGCYTLAGSSDGKFIYAMSGGSGVIRQFSRSQVDGSLALLNPSYVNSNQGPVDGKMFVNQSTGAEFLIVSNKNADTTGLMQVYTRNTSTGQLSTNPTSTLTFGPTNVRPQGICIVDNHVYVGSFTANFFYAFTFDPVAGTLAPQANPTVPTNSGPCFICASPDGAHVYAVTDSGATVYQYSRDSSTGALTPLSPASIPAGNGPYSICMAPDGRSVYAGNSDGQTISQYTRDTATGLLTAMTPAQVRSDPAVTAAAGSNGPPGMIVSGDGKNLYASGKKAGANSVITFVIHP